MNNFETIENTPNIDEDWQKEKDLWEKEVKEEVWPTYERGVQEVKEAYAGLTEVFESKEQNIEDIQKAAHVLNIVAQEALNKFDDISEDILKGASKTSAIFLAADMVSHRARKFFVAVISVAALLEMLIQDNETDKLELLPLDKQNLVDKDYFLNIWEIGNLKVVNTDLYLESFKYGGDNDNGFVVEMDNNLPDEQIRLSHKVLIDEAIKEFINNAKEAMHGKGKVVVGVCQEDNNLCFYVQDNGPGIPKERQKEIWKAKVSTKERGTGMGLCYLKTVIEDLLKGAVTVESEEGKGAKFIISIPKLKK